MTKKKKKQKRKRRKKREKSPMEKVRKPIPKPGFPMRSKKDYKRKRKYPKNWEDDN